MSAHPQRSDLSEGSWNDLFDFLDPSRPTRSGPGRDSVAEAKYLELYRKLTHFFAGRGCPEAEDLAVETVLRVAARCRDLEVSGFADRNGYFYGVARNVLHEWMRDSLRESTKRDGVKRELGAGPGNSPDAWQRKELVDRYLETCLAKLTRRARQLVLSYYSGEPGAKIAAHQSLADQFGKSLNALRIEIHRIRKALRECVTTALRCADSIAGAPAGASGRGRPT